MRLLERLLNLLRVEPVAPGENFFGALADGVPQLDGGVGGERDGFEVDVDDGTVEPDAGDGFRDSRFLRKNGWLALTPALSPRERGNCSPLVSVSTVVPVRRNCARFELP